MSWETGIEMDMVESIWELTPEHYIRENETKIQEPVKATI
jgi:hypothetical protein